MMILDETWGVYRCCGLVVWNVKFMFLLTPNKNSHFGPIQQLCVACICKREQYTENLWACLCTHLWWIWPEYFCCWI